MNPELSLQKLAKLLSIMETQVSNDDFVKAFELVMKYVNDGFARTETEVVKILKEIQKIDDRINTKNEMTMGGHKMALSDTQKQELTKLESRVMARLALLKDGRTPRKGFDYFDGGKGNDGSPDTSKQVRDKLESLPDGEKQSIQSIQDLPKMLEEIGQRIVSSRSGAGLISVRTRFVDDETMTGAVNGSNTAFTISRSPVAGSLKVYRGGARQRVTEDFTISDKTITFIVAPVSGEILLADFRY